MSTPDGKMLATAAYHSAIVSGLAMSNARLSKMILKRATPKLDFIGYDVGMVVLDVAMMMATNEMLIKQSLMPADILK